MYLHRGKIIKGPTDKYEIAQVWLAKVKEGKEYYEINREHPLIASLLNTDKELVRVLRLIEETVPVSSMIIQDADEPFHPPYQGASTELKELLKCMFDSLSKKYPIEDVRNRLLHTQPFDEYPDLISAL